MRRRRRVILRHEMCLGVLRKGADGVWTCEKCGGKVEIGVDNIGEIVTALYPAAARDKDTQE